MVNAVKSLEKLLYAAMVLFLILAFLPESGAAAPSPEKVYILPIEGAIEPGLAAFVARILREAEENNAAVVLKVNTFGGRVDAATNIRDLIIRMDMPVIAFVSERAWSAGALITMAAPKVAMAPGSSIGAAEPVPMDEKTVSALRAEFESTAERAGRDPRIAAAMVDADIVIEDLVEADKILTLRAVQAVELGVADVLAVTLEEVLEFFDLADLPIEEKTPNWSEVLARWITEPTISSLLLTIGFIGLIYEVTTMDWGVPGTAGLIALVLFFGGHMVAGLAGWETVILFLVGMILLMVEIFIIPGFGVAGALGLIGILASIGMAFGSVLSALTSLSIALAAAVLFIAVFWKRFTRSGAWRKLVLATREDKELGYRGPKVYTDLVGKRGVTLTPLRPSGTVIIEGDRYDVVSDGGFLASDVSIIVTKIEGTRVVVRELTSEENENS